MQAVIDGELDVGEVVLWQGQPLAHQRFRSGFGVWFIGVPWTAFAAFWIIGAASSTGLLLALWGLPFLGLGALMLSSPWVARRNARGSVYVVTDRRVLLIEQSVDLRGARTKIKTMRPQLTERLRRDNGTGDITFEERVTRSDDTTSTPTGFRDIADVDTVEKLIRRTFIDQR